MSVYLSLIHWHDFLLVKKIQSKWINSRFVVYLLTLNNLKWSYISEVIIYDIAVQIIMYDIMYDIAEKPILSHISLLFYLEFI